MGRYLTTQEWEQMISQLEQGGLLEAPPTLEAGVMEKIAMLERQEAMDHRYSEKTRRVFYQLKISAAMAASLVLVLLPTGSLSYEASPYGQAKQMVWEREEPSWLDYMQQGVSTISEGVSSFSGYAMNQIMEVFSYDK